MFNYCKSTYTRACAKLVVQNEVKDSNGKHARTKSKIKFILASTPCCWYCVCLHLSTTPRHGYACQERWYTLCFTKGNSESRLKACKPSFPYMGEHVRCATPKYWHDNFQGMAPLFSFSNHTQKLSMKLVAPNQVLSKFFGAFPSNETISIRGNTSPQSVHVSYHMFTYQQSPITIWDLHPSLQYRHIKWMRISWLESKFHFKREDFSSGR